MPPKPRDKTNAMLADVDSVKEELQRETADAKGAAKKELEAAVAAVKKELMAEISSAGHKWLETAKEQAKGSGNENAAHEKAALRQLIQDSLAQAQNDIIADVEQVNLKTKREFANTLHEMSVKFDEAMASQLKTLEELIALRASERDEADAKLQAQIDETPNICKAQIDAAMQEVRDQVSGLSDDCQNMAAKLSRQEKDMEAIRKKLTADMDEQKQSLQESIAKLDEDQQAAMKTMQATLDAGAQELSVKMQKLDADTDTALKACYTLINDVENVPTKRVDWVIKGASSVLKPPPPSADVPSDEVPFCSWKSPKFDAGGTRDLQLELRVYRKVNPPAEGQERGDCAVFLTAPKGTNIACRLLVGTASQSFEKRFNTGREVLGTGRLCFLEDQVDSATNKVSVSIEVLEAVCQLDKEAKPKNGDETGEEWLTSAGGLLESAFLLHRHINYRVLQQVRSQVDHLKSRTVRRVEWRLEEASRMRRSFQKGAPMKSKEFDAAGIEGLQLVFYPSGHDSASEGFCSLFLRAPGGASVSCTLQAGPEKRELSQTWEREGQYGRANFCRFESCIDDAEDTILVVIDIDNAHQDISARMGHLPPPIAGIRSLTDEDSVPAPIGSVIKVHRDPVKVPADLQEVKVLPAITAGRNRHDPAAKLYPSSSCGALRDRRSGGSEGSWRRRKPLM